MARTSEHRSLRSAWWRGVKAERLIYAFPGVVMDKSKEADPNVWLRAVRAWDPNLIISGAAAASLSFDPEQQFKKLIVYAQKSLESRSLVQFRQSRLGADFTTWVDGFRVTNVEATAITAALDGDFNPGTTALRNGRTTPRRILECALKWPERQAVAARAVARDFSGNPWSPAEVDAHRLFREAGILGWEGNRGLWVNGQKLVPDIGLHSVRIGFEVNSFEHHSTKEAMEHDAGRLNQFLAARWRLYTLTPSQVRDFKDETKQFIRSVVPARFRGKVWD